MKIVTRPKGRLDARSFGRFRFGRACRTDDCHICEKITRHAEAAGATRRKALTVGTNRGI